MVVLLSSKINEDYIVKKDNFALGLAFCSAIREIVHFDIFIFNVGIRQVRILVFDNYHSFHLLIT